MKISRNLSPTAFWAEISKSSTTPIVVEDFEFFLTLYWVRKNSLKNLNPVGLRFFKPELQTQSSSCV